MNNQQFRELVKSGLQMFDSDSLCDSGKEIINKLRQDLDMGPIMDLDDIEISVDPGLFTIDTDYVEEFANCYCADDIHSELDKIVSKLVLLDKDDCVIAKADNFSIDEVIDTSY